MSKRYADTSQMVSDYPDEPDDYYTRGREDELVDCGEEENDEYLLYLKGER
jgi:hypothetical protein